MKKKDDEQIQPEETPPQLPDYINDAFDAFFELDPNASMLDRFDALSHAIVAYRFYLLDRHRRTGKKKIDAEEVFLFDCNEQFKHIEKILISAKKMGRIHNAVNDNYETGLLAKIVKMKGSMGDIVTTVPTHKKAE